MVESAKIVALSVAAAVAYGILHDQVTARVCVEYFTIGHPPVFGTEDPTLLGIGWGIIATWWVGLLLGVPLAACARAGQRPKLAARDLARPIVSLLVVMGSLALLGGLAGGIAASTGGVWLVEPFASRVPRERHVRYIMDLWAHLVSYGSGFVGGIVVCVHTWRRRGRTGAAPVAAVESPA
ncbi:MAG: hypothetical protein L0216_19580 [Planctomycetales bacterium]|nr:hypothetical protein [Planctomycetales bacterium]